MRSKPLQWCERCYEVTEHYQCGLFARYAYLKCKPCNIERAMAWAREHRGQVNAKRRRAYKERELVPNAF